MTSGTAEARSGRQQRSGQRKQQILLAAARLFHRAGYHAYLGLLWTREVQHLPAAQRDPPSRGAAILTAGEEPTR